MLTQEALLSPLKERESQYSRFLRTRGASLPEASRATYTMQHLLVQVRPYTLHPTPYTLHPTPYTLNPKP